MPPVERDRSEPDRFATVLSVNVGRPRVVDWKNSQITTGIFKRPVTGPVGVRTLNLEGDGQADLRVHGGWDKAIYAYASEQYALWQAERPELDLRWACFGENLTTAGLVDADVNVGDVFRVGTAELIVTQPRLPCFKLGIAMGREDFTAEFLERGLLGFYFAVVREGVVSEGDPIVVLRRDPCGFNVTEITRLYAHDRDDVEGLQKAVGLEVLPEGWRNYFRKRLSDLERRGTSTLLPAPLPPAWAGFRSFEVQRKVRENEDVQSFYLRPSDGRPLPPYRPGQYLTLRVATASSGTSAIRSYSLSDKPDRDVYRVTVKRIRSTPANPSGGLVSTLLHEHTEVGAEIEVKAPAGLFTLDPAEAYRPVVLIGGGIGITPILAMANSIVEHGRKRETWIFYGVRDQRDQFMRQHLEELAARDPSIHLHVCHSQPLMDDGRARGSEHCGRVSVDLLRELLPASYYDYYICGPGAMMQSLSDGLREWGVPDDRIHSEAFGPAAIKAGAPDPDSRRDCGIQVTFARSQTVAVWSRCDSPLLELAEEVGISIPFGCRAGSCGTCVTTVVSGEVSYLHPPGAPIAKGEILACVAAPQSTLVLDV